MKRGSWKKKLAMGLMLGSACGILASSSAFAQEMTLQQSVAKAIENNRTIKMMQAQVMNAEGVLKQAKGARGLNVNWQASGSHINNGRPTKILRWTIKQPNKSFSNVITAGYPIYTGGLLESNIKGAQIGTTISELNLENVRQQVKLQATQDYYKILECQNNVDVQKNSVIQLAAHERVAQAKFDAGVVPKTDLLSSQVQLANARQNLVLAQNDLQMAVSNFNQVIGQDVNASVEPTDSYLKEFKYPLTLQECMQQALNNRPDGFAARESVKQAQEAVRAAKAGGLPQVSLVAQKTIAGDSMFDDGQKDLTTYGVNASWDIFDNNVTNAKVAQAEANLYKAEENASNTDSQIQLDVRNAYLSMLAAKQNIDTTMVAVKQAAENDRIAQIRYEAGVGTNIDRLDANVAYVTAQTNHNRALYNYTVGLAALDRAMGVPSNFWSIEKGNDLKKAPKEEKNFLKPNLKSSEKKLTAAKKAPTGNDAAGLNVLDRLPQK